MHAIPYCDVTVNIIACNFSSRWSLFLFVLLLTNVVNGIYTWKKENTQANKTKKVCWKFALFLCICFDSYKFNTKSNCCRFVLLFYFILSPQNWNKKMGLIISCRRKKKYGIQLALLQWFCLQLLTVQRIKSNNNKHIRLFFYGCSNYLVTKLVSQIVIILYAIFVCKHTEWYLWLCVARLRGCQVKNKWLKERKRQRERERKVFTGIALVMRTCIFSQQEISCGIVFHLYRMIVN